MKGYNELSHNVYNYEGSVYIGARGVQGLVTLFCCVRVLPDFSVFAFSVQLVCSILPTL